VFIYVLFMLSTIRDGLLVELFFVHLLIFHTVGKVLLLEMILARYQKGLEIEQAYNAVFPYCGPKMASNTK
jgi:hypothetical protein